MALPSMRRPQARKARVSTPSRPSCSTDDSSFPEPSPTRRSVGRSSTPAQRRARADRALSDQSVAASRARPLVAPSRDSSRRAAPSPPRTRPIASGPAPTAASRKSVADKRVVRRSESAGQRAAASLWRAPGLSPTARPAAATARAAPTSTSSPSGVRPGPRPSRASEARPASEASPASSARSRCAKPTRPRRLVPRAVRAERASARPSAAGAGIISICGTRGLARPGRAGISPADVTEIALASNGAPGPARVTTGPPATRWSIPPPEPSTSTWSARVSHSHAGRDAHS